MITRVRAATKIPSIFFRREEEGKKGRRRGWRGRRCRFRGLKILLNPTTAAVELRCLCVDIKDNVSVMLSIGTGCV